MLNKVIEHIRNRAYMGGLERDQLRVKATGEVFTPTPLVQEILDKLPIEQFTDSAKTFLDPSCGDGQFLGEVLIRKIENGSTFEQALSTTYGVDLMIDNVDLCRERLLCGREDLRHIVEKNIVCYDGLKYDYKFARRKNTEVRYELRARKKADDARKKAAKEKAKLEERMKKEIHKIELEIRSTGIEATEKLVNKELKKLGLI